MSDVLNIESLDLEARGIARRDGKVIFVEGALPGERVRAVTVRRKPSYETARVEEILRPSSQRVAPRCPHFGVCGGCALQHWAHEPYLAWKRRLVLDAMRHAGFDAALDAVVEATIDAHGEGRRRATFHARRRGYDVLEVGFAAPREHRIVAIDDCPILAPALGGALRAAWAIAEALKEMRKPLDIQVTQTDGGLDIDLRGSGPLTAPQTAMLARIADEQALARLTRHGELVAGVQLDETYMGMGLATREAQLAWFAAAGLPEPTLVDLPAGASVLAVRRPA